MSDENVNPDDLAGEWLPEHDLDIHWVDLEETDRCAGEAEDAADEDFADDGELDVEYDLEDAHDRARLADEIFGDEDE